MAPSQAELLALPHSLVHETMQGEQTPCVHQPMSLHRLSISWDATPSWKKLPLFFWGR
jgi:hypothetical protein